MHFNNLLFAAMSVCAVSCADNVEKNKWLFPEDHDTDGWRSALYPVDWTPDFRDAQGRLSMIFPMPVIMEDWRTSPCLIGISWM